MVVPELSFGCGVLRNVSFVSSDSAPGHVSQGSHRHPKIWGAKRPLGQQPGRDAPAPPRDSRGRPQERLPGAQGVGDDALAAPRGCPGPGLRRGGAGRPSQVREEGPAASRARAGGGRPACVRNRGCQGRGRSPRRGGGVRRGPRARAGPELLPSAGGARGRLAPGSGPTHRLLPRLR